MSNSDVFGSPMVLPGVRPASPFGAAVKPSLVHKVVNTAAGIAQQVFGPTARRMRIRRTVVQLSALEDHMLRDIGLDRSSIISTAYEVEEQMHDHRGRAHSLWR